MGYLSSCRADSSILTSNSHYPNASKSKKTKSKEENGIQEFNYSDLVVATNGFSEQKLLGKGSHGCVYKGVLQSGKLVAIKKPSRSSAVRLAQNSSSSGINTSEVDNEIHILSKISSPGLVNLVGFSNDSIDRLLVVEFMSNGHRAPCGIRSNSLNNPRHRDGGSWDLVDRSVGQSMRNSKRVHSNLGLEARNNLMDLMAETDGKSKFRGEAKGVEPASPAGSRASSFRGGSGRIINRDRAESLSHSYKRDDVFQLRRTQTTGGRSVSFSKSDRLGRFTGASYCIQAADPV
ncbi:hypothetical protein IFM89_006915 [Coptis chinensis]|uniref:Protein kinase domain-containing protein n=1 Tax=Coptis chinensis TaxID=261450 RepID=A0A835LHQ5_9MAGN|nr:hypothetical protein IFM89_006915 [Coptis chinensis]